METFPQFSPQQKLPRPPPEMCSHCRRSRSLQDPSSSVMGSLDPGEIPKMVDFFFPSAIWDAFWDLEIRIWSLIAYVFPVNTTLFCHFLQEFALIRAIQASNFICITQTKRGNVFGPHASHLQCSHQPVPAIWFIATSQTRHLNELYAFKKQEKHSDSIAVQF